MLKSFLGGLKVGLGDMSFSLHVDPEKRAADSGSLEFDLPSLFVAVASFAMLF